MSSLIVPNSDAVDPPIFRRLGVLEVREILDIIMAFLDYGGDLFVASLVCKTWSSVALDHLWRTLDSVVPLCKLLGPLALYADCWRYTDTIFEADWARFEFYSRKVRRIENDGLLSGWGELGPGALAQVVNSRPPSIPYILLRVTEINWAETEADGWLLELVPLLAPTLKSFTLTVLSESATSVTDARVVLRHLAFLPGLKLESLHARWLDPSPRLTSAVCDVLDRQRESLKSFFHRSFDLDKRLSTSITQLANLLHLELNFSTVNRRTDEDFNGFSDVLASRCPGLKKIRFCIPFGPREFTFYAFRPLTRIEGLREFSLECGDLDLKVRDFREMGEAWRSLVAIGFPDSWIPLPWFATIAEHFSPALEDIHVDIRVPEDLDSDCTILTPFTPSLKRISIIRFATPGTFKAVGSVLRQLVAPNTVVECAKWMEERLKGVTGNSVKWKGKWEREDIESSLVFD